MQNRQKVNKINLYTAYDRHVEFNFVNVLQLIYTAITVFMYYYTYVQQCCISEDAQSLFLTLLKSRL